MEVVIRASVIFWFLWLVVRGIGKRSLAELTPLDLLLVVVIGDFVQQGVTGEDMSVAGGMIAASVLVVWTLLANSVSRRSRRSAAILNGEPVIVVRDGVPLVERMERERITGSDLEEAARMEGIDDLSKVSFAVLEADGRFSFITKER